MKKLIIILAMGILSITSYATENIIGKLTNGVPTITANTELLLQDLNNHLKANGIIDVELSQISIESRVLNGETYYILMAKGSGHKTTLALTYNVGSNEFPFMAYKETCETTGCSENHGCEAGLATSGCSPCNKDCKKTTSTEITLFILSDKSKNY